MIGQGSSELRSVGSNKDPACDTMTTTSFTECSDEHRSRLCRRRDCKSIHEGGTVAQKAQKYSLVMTTDAYLQLVRTNGVEMGGFVES